MPSTVQSRVSRRAFLKGLAGVAVLCHAPARLLAAVASEADVFTQSRLLMGTFVSISVAGADTGRAEEAVGRAFERMGALEAVLSRHDSRSPLSALNAHGRLEGAPEELRRLLERARRMGDVTGGAFDVTVTPILELFRAHQNPKGVMRLDARELAEARALVDAGALRLEGRLAILERQGMAVTLDGIAKGYIVDCAAQTLREHGVDSHLINAGGDIRAQGSKAPGKLWRVAVEDPAKRGRPVTALDMPAMGGGIATSGGYEVFYDAARRHHHLIDPVSGGSPTQARSVSVTAPDALRADALATAFSVMAPHDALRLTRALPGVECCILNADGAVMLSEGWGRG